MRIDEFEIVQNDLGVQAFRDGKLVVADPWLLRSLYDRIQFYENRIVQPTHRPDKVWYLDNLKSADLTQYLEMYIITPKQKDGDHAVRLRNGVLIMDLSCEGMTVDMASRLVLNLTLLVVYRPVEIVFSLDIEQLATKKFSEIEWGKGVPDVK